MVLVGNDSDHCMRMRATTFLLYFSAGPVSFCLVAKDDDDNEKSFRLPAVVRTTSVGRQSRRARRGPSTASHFFQTTRRPDDLLSQLAKMTTTGVG